MIDDTTPTQQAYLAARHRYEAARKTPSHRSERGRAHLEYLATLRAMRDEIEGTSR